MARENGKAGPDVGNYDHAEAKRANIPTAENQGLVPDEDKAVRTLRYPRNPDLDPQLVWRGKDREDEQPLEVQAPPVYIQEKIHPKAIVADLKRRTKAARPAPDAPDLFHDFNGLPEGWREDATGSYYHDEGNWSNRMILGDSLLVMGSLAEREKLRGQVQCIYFDPPYGIKFNSNWQPSTKSRDVKDGKSADITREPEQIKAFRDTWKDGVSSYLSYMRDRLTAMRDLLHESGSIFVQISDENVHRVRALLDEVFGTENFCAEIVFTKATGLTSDLVASVFDYILWYGKSRPNLKFRTLYRERDFEIDRVGEFRNIDRVRQAAEIDDKACVYRTNSAVSPGVRANTTGSFSYLSLAFDSGPNRNWKSTLPGMTRLAKADRLVLTASPSRMYKQFWTDFSQTDFTNIWSDVRSEQDRIYVVQTVERVIQRCVLMTTDPGDLVLDPTCGSGTTATVAEQWGRRWITIDTSRVALALARTRLMSARYDWYLPRDSAEGAAKEAELTGKPPAADAAGPSTASRSRSPNELGEDKRRPDLRQGFVYERAPRVTLKSIANNAEIDVIWDKWQATLEPLRRRLNDALGESWEEWQVPRELPSSPSGASGRSVPRTDLNPAGQGSPEAGTGVGDVSSIARPADSPHPNPSPEGEGLSAADLHAAWWAARRERQAEIDASIARGAEVELLYDRPYKAKGVVRLAGPFTVESLSPHRVLPLEEDPLLLDALQSSPNSFGDRGGSRLRPGDEAAAAMDHAQHGGGAAATRRSSPAEPLHHSPAASGPPPRGKLGEDKLQTDFAQVVYENLKAAGVQNSKKGEAIRFEWLKPFASRRGYVAFEGVYLENGQERRAAVCIGPEYDTVGYDLVRAAAREARDLFDTLIVCGFAFAPEVDDSRLNFGALTVLKARMNQDLRMGDKLKATGAGNLFVVFGEPDIAIEDAGDDQVRIRIKGVDIFDPTSGEVRSSADPAEDIACWFVDDDYDEESFFVRQAYFLGRDPYESLKRALKAEIDEAAWAELNSTVSRAFPRPASGRVCVKVINHFGDEVQKVFDV